MGMLYRIIMYDELVCYIIIIMYDEWVCYIE